MSRGRHIALDVASGLHALHIRNIVHFDIKSPNILLTRNLDAKIADVVGVGLLLHLALAQCICCFCSLSLQPGFACPVVFLSS